MGQIDSKEDSDCPRRRRPQYKRKKRSRSQHHPTTHEVEDLDYITITSAVNDSRARNSKYNSIPAHTSNIPSTEIFPARETQNNIFPTACTSNMQSASDAIADLSNKLSNCSMAELEAIERSLSGTNDQTHTQRPSNSGSRDNLSQRGNDRRNERGPRRGRGKGRGGNYQNQNNEQLEESNDGQNTSHGRGGNRGKKQRGSRGANRDGNQGQNRRDFNYGNQMFDEEGMGNNYRRRNHEGGGGWYGNDYQVESRLNASDGNSVKYFDDSDETSSVDGSINNNYSRRNRGRNDEERQSRSRSVGIGGGDDARSTEGSVDNMSNGRRRGRGGGRGRRGRRQGQKKEEIAFTVDAQKVAVAEKKKIFYNDECPICTADIEEEHFVTLECLHRLHNKCAFVLAQKQTILFCPICRNGLDLTLT